MNFKCIDNNGSLIALTTLTIGKSYKGKKINDGFFVEIYPCDNGEVWVFSSDRFEEIL